MEIPFLQLIIQRNVHVANVHLILSLRLIKVSKKVFNQAKNIYILYIINL